MLLCVCVCVRRCCGCWVAGVACGGLYSSHVGTRTDDGADVPFVVSVFRNLSLLITDSNTDSNRGVALTAVTMQQERDRYTDDITDDNDAVDEDGKRGSVDI